MEILSQLSFIHIQTQINTHTLSLTHSLSLAPPASPAALSPFHFHSLTQLTGPLVCITRSLSVREDGAGRTVPSMNRPGFYTHRERYRPAYSAHTHIHTPASSVRLGLPLSGSGPKSSSGTFVCKDTPARGYCTEGKKIILFFSLSLYRSVSVVSVRSLGAPAPVAAAASLPGPLST